VKGIQQEMGKDKLQVLLLSVDCGYGLNQASAIAGDLKAMKRQGVEDWPNVILKDGFKDAQRMFNLDGYGLSLIGPDGVVRGIHLFKDDVKTLLKDIENTKS
jgi:hypothetical protein